MKNTTLTSRHGAATCNIYAAVLAALLALGSVYAYAHTASQCNGVLPAAESTKGVPPPLDQFDNIGPFDIGGRDASNTMVGGRDASVTFLRVAHSTGSSRSSDPSLLFNASEDEEGEGSETHIGHDCGMNVPPVLLEREAKFLKGQYSVVRSNHPSIGPPFSPEASPTRETIQTIFEKSTVSATQRLTHSALFAVLECGGLTPLSGKVEAASRGECSCYPRVSHATFSFCTDAHFSYESGVKPPFIHFKTMAKTVRKTMEKAMEETMTLPEPKGSGRGPTHQL